MNDDHHSHQDNDCHNERSANQRIKDSEREGQAKPQAKPSKGFRHQWGELKLDQKIESLIGGIGLVFAAILSITASCQLGAMKAQLDEMKSGSEDTKIIAQSTKIQAENTAKMAEAAMAQVGELKASVKTAQEANSFTHEAFRLEQRAWVGPTSFLPPGEEDKYFKEGSRPSFGVVITNTGKTPARNVQVRIGRSTFRKGSTFKPIYNDDGGPSGTIALFPGQPFMLITKPELPLTAEQVAIIINGEFTLYVYGMVTYEDVFGIKHKSTFCGYMASDLRSFKSCGTYNQVD
jgi:hypothetical protein